MASPKKEQFTKEEIKLARFAKALSHPARIAILRHLASLETCCFKEISLELPLADSTVSQHLAELKRAGLVQEKSEHPKVIYFIDHGNWKLARKYFKEFIRIRVAKNEKEN
jgi:ArsR family transcriptional regulator, arsenate/arsenite/antimonite-responsive transcriptional repressor